jgi:hypothetical protein
LKEGEFYVNRESALSDDSDVIIWYLSGSEQTDASDDII